jgi:hypothetical protein
MRVATFPSQGEFRMRTFKLAVYQDSNGYWCFRWWNVNPSDPGATPFCQGLVPCRSKQEAETEKQEFIEAEKQRHPWTVFESAE